MRISSIFSSQTPKSEGIPPPKNRITDFVQKYIKQPISHAYQSLAGRISKEPPTPPKIDTAFQSGSALGRLMQSVHNFKQNPTMLQNAIQDLLNDSKIQNPKKAELLMHIYNSDTKGLIEQLLKDTPGFTCTTEAVTFHEDKPLSKKDPLNAIVKDSSLSFRDKVAKLNSSYDLTDQSVRAHIAQHELFKNLPDIRNFEMGGRIPMDRLLSSMQLSAPLDPPKEIPYTSMPEEELDLEGHLSDTAKQNAKESLHISSLPSPSQRKILARIGEQAVLSHRIDRLKEDIASLTQYDTQDRKDLAKFLIETEVFSQAPLEERQKLAVILDHLLPLNSQTAKDALLIKTVRACAEGSTDKDTHRQLAEYLSYCSRIQEPVPMERFQYLDPKLTAPSLGPKLDSSLLQDTQLPSTVKAVRPVRDNDYFRAMFVGIMERILTNADSSALDQLDAKITNAMNGTSKSEQQHLYGAHQTIDSLKSIAAPFGDFAHRLQGEQSSTVARELALINPENSLTDQNFIGTFRLLATSWVKDHAQDPRIQNGIKELGISLDNLCSKLNNPQEPIPDFIAKLSLFSDIFGKDIVAPIIPFEGGYAIAYT